MLSPSPVRIIAHSPCRGEALSRAGAPAASGGRALDVSATTVETEVTAWSACGSAAGAALVVVQAVVPIEITRPSLSIDGSRISPRLLFGRHLGLRGLCENLGEEFPDPIFRIIKWAPRPEASYEPGVASLVYKFQMQSTVVPCDLSHFIENFGREHWVIDRAQ